jgi:hypothetical protein
MNTKALLPSNDVLPAAMMSVGAILPSNDVLPAALMSSEAFNDVLPASLVGSESSNDAETLQADYPVGLCMIEMLLNHEPDFLDVRELGNLSISSKALFKLINPRWEVLWEQYVEAGAEFKQETTHRRYRWKGYPTHLWTHYQEGLLPCFASPDMKVLKRCGYKHAVGCLRSKVCCKCGEIVASANPFTLDRLCYICAEEDENSWLIHTSKAKDGFLLGKLDLQALASAVVPFRTAQQFWHIFGCFPPSRRCEGIVCEAWGRRWPGGCVREKENGGHATIPKEPVNGQASKE